MTVHVRSVEHLEEVIDRFAAHGQTTTSVVQSAPVPRRGVDVALEAVGSTATIQMAIESVRKGGTVTLIGNIAPKAEIPLQIVVSRQIRLQGSAASAGEYPRCIDLLSRRAIDLKPLISMVAPLEEGPQWFERLHGREANLMKVILRPGESK